MIQSMRSFLITYLWTSFRLVVNVDSQTSRTKFLILFDFNTKQREVM